MTPDIFASETLPSLTADNRPSITDHRPDFFGRRSSAVSRRPWLKWLLIGIVISYVAILILAPLGALVAGAFSRGFGAIVEALGEPDVLSAFWRTLLISVIVVIVHAICGTAVAWVLVRHTFRGRRLLNGLIDLPFAVSPVVAGYMLLLLFGRQGLFAPLADALGVKVAFALPGMLLATLFVTLPFMVRELMPVLEAFGVEQEQAAATIGASAMSVVMLGIAFGLVVLVDFLQRKRDDT
jgi:sulfate transport system permease protein